MTKQILQVDEIVTNDPAGILAKTPIQYDQDYILEPLSLITKSAAEALVEDLAGLPVSNAGAVTDWNTVITEGLLHGADTATNDPTTTSFFTAFNLQGNLDPLYNNLIGVDQVTKNWYVRNQDAGTWGAWRRLWDEGNLNPTRAVLYSGSLDFNSLQPYHHLYSVQAGAADVNFPTTIDLPVTGGHFYYDTNFQGDLAFTSGSIGSVDLKVRNKTGGAWSGWYTVWHANNSNKSSVDWNVKGLTTNYPLAVTMRGGIGLVSCWDAGQTVRHGLIQMDSNQITISQDTGAKVIQLGLNANKVGINTNAPREALEVSIGNIYAYYGRIMSENDNVNDVTILDLANFKAVTNDGSPPAYSFYMAGHFATALIARANTPNEWLMLRSPTGADYTVWHSGNLDPASVGGNFVTLDTVQTITGAKTFTSALPVLFQTNDNSIELQATATLPNIQGADYARGIPKGITMQMFGGSVGIGISPTAKFDVYSDGYELLRLRRMTTTDFSFHLGSSGEIYLVNNITSAYDIQVVNDNVGIGISPTEKLQVAGRVRFDLGAEGPSVIATGGASNFHIIHDATPNVNLLNTAGRIDINGNTVWHSGNSNNIVNAWRVTGSANLTGGMAVELHSDGINGHVGCYDRTLNQYKPLKFFASTMQYEINGVVMGNLSASGLTMTEFYRTSSRKEKRNIKPLKQSALNILLDTEIKTYTKKADGSPGVGFIAEDTDPILSGPNRDAHNFGAHLALLTKAVQELNDKINKLCQE